MLTELISFFKSDLKKCNLSRKTLVEIFWDFDNLHRLKSHLQKHNMTFIIWICHENLTFGKITLLIKRKENVLSNFGLDLGFTFSMW